MKMRSARRLGLFALLCLIGGLNAVGHSAYAQDSLGESGVKGAGSTFVYPLLAKWSREYREWLAGKEAYRAPNAGLDDPLPSSALQYEPVGSLAGTLRVKDRDVDFGASDMPLASDQLAAFGLGQFPIVVGGVIVAVNIDGVAGGQLRLSGPLLAQIFLGTVSRWSDPAIKQLNPGLQLPDVSIAVIHRSDGSGTTWNFTEYLSRVSPEWKLEAGSGLLVRWPTGSGAKGNEGVARAVRAVKNSIAYVEYAQARQLNLTHAVLQNRAGTFVSPSAASFQAAASSADWGKATDFNATIVDAPGRDAYPIAATVFALMHKQAWQNRTDSAIEFFRWSLVRGVSTASALGYAPLPAAVVQQVEAYWAKTFGVRPPVLAANQRPARTP